MSKENSTGVTEKKSAEEIINKHFFSDQLQGGYREAILLAMEQYTQQFLSPKGNGILEDYIRSLGFASSFISDPQNKGASKKFVKDGVTIFMPCEDKQEFVHEDLGVLNITTENEVDILLTLLQKYSATASPAPVEVMRWVKDGSVPENENPVWVQGYEHQLWYSKEYKCWYKIGTVLFVEWASRNLFWLYEPTPLVTDNNISQKGDQC